MPDVLDGGGRRTTDKRSDPNTAGPLPRSWAAPLARGCLTSRHARPGWWWTGWWWKRAVSGSLATSWSRRRRLGLVARRGEAARPTCGWCGRKARTCRREPGEHLSGERFAQRLGVVFDLPAAGTRRRFSPQSWVGGWAPSASCRRARLRVWVAGSGSPRDGLASPRCGGKGLTTAPRLTVTARRPSAVTHPRQRAGERAASMAPSQSWEPVRLSASRRQSSKLKAEARTESTDGNGTQTPPACPIGAAWRQNAVLWTA